MLIAMMLCVAFLRLTTHPRIFETPLSTDAALDYVNHWLAQPCARALDPGERHWLILSQLLRKDGTAGNLTNDAHLAALAIEHGACLHTADTDFLRFPDLTVRNPLTTPRLQEPTGTY